MSDIEQTPEFTKKQIYHKEYYKQHSDVVGKYSFAKYAKRKYKLTSDECDTFGEDHCCTYGKYLQLKKTLQEKFPNYEF